VSRRRLALVTLCALVVIVGGWMLARTNHSESAPTTAGRTGETGETGGQTCPIGTLPHEVVDTVKRIQTGGPFPFPRSDGAVFTNREGHLPKQRRGFYHEYTVVTPRARDRSIRRIVTGGTPLVHPPQYFYTGDHYDSFCLVTDAGSEQ
jgi:ribonuclease T1